jgi:hypothetical protein
MFYQPELFCPEGFFQNWIMAINSLFKNIQFIIGLSLKSSLSFSHIVEDERLEIPCISTIAKKYRKKENIGLQKSVVLLVDIDSRIPNIPLMKLSRHLKNHGKHVKLIRNSDRPLTNVSQVYASCVFNTASSITKVDNIRKHYGELLTVGGSGVDLSLRLPDDIESLSADYNLYPELSDRAIGFLTRGCQNNCSYCIVPIKDGKPRQVDELDNILQSHLKKLILLDDNILSYSGADMLLEEIMNRDIEVNFNQTLDIRLVDKERAGLLRRIKCRNIKFTRNNYYFSLNDCNNFDKVNKNYQLFNFQSRKDNVEFICMYGYNTTLAEDVERFLFLRSLPAAYVFVQEYRPIINGKKPDLEKYFDENAYENINKLIRIIFPQNMKSMEKFYRWLGKRYYQTFGTLHTPLIDTIFRYNHRDDRGQYLAKFQKTLDNK